MRALHLCIPWRLSTRSGNRYILVIVDAFSRFAEAYPLKDTTAEVLAETLWREFLSRYGIPKRIHSDQGRNFTAAVLKRSLDFFGIRRTTTVAYCPQGNGIVERLNRTIQDVVSKSLSKEQVVVWDEHLPTMMYAYNVIPHVETKVAPFTLFFGRLPRWPASFNQDTNFQIEEAEKFKIMKNIFDRTTQKISECSRNHDFNPGDLVLVYRPNVPTNIPKKFTLPWKGPYNPVKKSVGPTAIC